MTKQEEIREGIKKVVLATYLAAAIGTSISDVLETSTKELLTRLHSQGVVIKVERELPGIRPSIVSLDPLTNAIGTEQSAWQMTGQRIMLQDMLDAGYVAVEPLIEVWVKNKPLTLTDLDEAIKQVAKNKPGILLMSQRTQWIFQALLNKFFKGGNK